MHKYIYKYYLHTHNLIPEVCIFCASRAHVFDFNVNIYIYVEIVRDVFGAANLSVFHVAEVYECARGFFYGLCMMHCSRVYSIFMILD